MRLWICTSNPKYRRVLKMARYSRTLKTFSNVAYAKRWDLGVIAFLLGVLLITPLGKLFGALIALIGIGLFALPAGILASGFAEEIHREREAKKCCPHCGKELS